MANAFALRLDALVGARLGPRLNAAGFGKSRRTFRRSRGPLIDIFQVQASQWGSVDEGRFTINLAIYVPGILTALGETPHAEPPEYVGHVRRRIGDLESPKQDRWWELRATTDLVALAAVLETTWLEKVDPWFGRIATLEDVRRNWSSAANDVQGVVLSYLLGDLDSARLDLRVLMQTLPPEASEERARAQRFAAEHGLTSDQLVDSSRD